MAAINLNAVRTRNAGKQDLVDDCIRVRDLLANGYTKGLLHLEGELEQFVKKNGTHKKALTTALREAEIRCGLNPNVPIYMRILSADEFGQYGGQGGLFKDIGVSALHGEYTHRLQWYVIVHAMSNGFTNDVTNVVPSGWNHKPRDLLVRINTESLDIQERDWPEGKEGFGGLWDALFDRGVGVHPGYDPYDDGISNPEIFNVMLMDRKWLLANHSGINDMMDVFNMSYPNCYGAFSGSHPTLSRIVTQRYVKRSGPKVLSKQEYIQKKLKQKSPKTVYVKGPAPAKKGDVMGVLEMKIAEETSKGHCFLTTACVEARGLPDDCEELQVLRAFRDGYLRRLPEGSGLIQEYYALAPRIVARIQQRHDARDIWASVYTTVREAVAHVRHEQPDAALHTYRGLVQDLSERYLAPRARTE